MSLVISFKPDAQRHRVLTCHKAITLPTTPSMVFLMYHRFGLLSSKTCRHKKTLPIGRVFFDQKMVKDALPVSASQPDG